MNNAVSNIFFGGVPTGPDVNKLVDAFPAEKLVPGYKIPYDEISNIIGQEQKTSRWRSVTNAWRKKIEKDHNIIIKCDPNERAFVVLSEGGKVQLSGEKLRSAVTSARRSIAILTTVDLKKLTEDDRKLYDFQAARAANIVATGQLRSGKNNLPEIEGK